MTEDVYITRAIELFENWLSGWSPAGKKCCLLYGPVGVGKTFTLKYVAGAGGYAIFAVDEDMSAAEIINHVRKATTLSGKKRIVWLDRPYLMGLKGRDLASIVAAAKVPVVFEDESNKYYQHLGCAEIYVHPPPKTWVVKKIREKAKVKPNFRAVADDVRQSILLAYGSQGYSSHNWADEVKKYLVTGQADSLDWTHLPAILDTLVVYDYGLSLLDKVHALVAADLSKRLEILRSLKPRYRVAEVNMYYYQKLKAMKELNKTD